MADDRPANDDIAAVVGELQRKLDDIESTALARSSRLPTGLILPTLLAVPLPDTLFLLGQTLNRADYPVLWKWVADNSPAGFGIGDGTTTFVLPDLRGRVLVGAGTGPGGAAYALGAVGGSLSVQLSVAQLPAHNHSSASHSHSVSVSNESTAHHHGTNDSGNHGGHNNTSLSVAIGQQGNAYVLRTATGNVDSGIHDHGLTGGQDAFHSHPASANAATVDIGSTGQNSPIDVRQPWFAGNYLIWT